MQPRATAPWTTATQAPTTIATHRLHAQYSEGSSNNESLHHQPQQQQQTRQQQQHGVRHRRGADRFQGRRQVCEGRRLHRRGSGQPFDGPRRHLQGAGWREHQRPFRQRKCIKTLNLARLLASVWGCYSQSFGDFHVPNCPVKKFPKYNKD